MTVLIGSLIDVVILGSAVLVYKSAAKMPLVRHNHRRKG